MRCSPGCTPALANKLPPLSCRPTAPSPKVATFPLTNHDSDRIKALSLLRKRSIGNVRAAITLLTSASLRNPDDLTLQLELAEAHNTAARILTYGNAIILEGTLENANFKRIWKEHGDRALPLAKAAYKKKVHGVRSLAAYAEAFMYSASSKGILQQAISGSGIEFKRFSNELRAYPEFDSSVGSAYLGCFYNVAPWPIGDKFQAAKYLQEGIDRAPSRRNLYYAGVNAFQMGHYVKASDYFGRAMRSSCGSDTERDFGEWLLIESRRGLEMSKSRARGSDAI